MKPSKFSRVEFPLNERCSSYQQFKEIERRENRKMILQLLLIAAVCFMAAYFAS